MPSPEVVGGKRSVHVDTPAAGRDPTPGGAPCKRQRSVGRLDPAAGQQEAVAGQHGGVAGQHGGVAGQHGSLAELQAILTELVDRQVLTSSEAEQLQSDLAWTYEADISTMIRGDYELQHLQELCGLTTGRRVSGTPRPETVRARIVRYIIDIRDRIERYFRDVRDRRSTSSYDECGFYVSCIQGIREDLERDIRNIYSDSGESEQEQEAAVQQESEQQQEAAVQQESEQQQEATVQQGATDSDGAVVIEDIPRADEEQGLHRLERMFHYMTTYTHPQAWRCCAGGSWANAACWQRTTSVDLYS
jgi:hypothetical protein